MTDSRAASLYIHTLLYDLLYLGVTCCVLQQTAASTCQWFSDLQLDRLQITSTTFVAATRPPLATEAFPTLAGACASTSSEHEQSPSVSNSTITRAIMLNKETRCGILIQNIWVKPSHATCNFAAVLPTSYEIRDYNLQSNADATN